jgi:hypothetical protein
MENTPKHAIKIFNFNEAYTVPSYKYNPKLHLIEWGDKNNYPKYVLDIYNAYGSTTHKSIIDRKVRMIAGQGWEDVTNLQLQEFIEKNKLNKVVKRVDLDYELFNGFALEVIYDREGVNIVSLKHIPFHKIRIGTECEEIPFEHYWFCEDWDQYKKPEYEPELIRGYNPYVKQGKQLYFYSEYNPQTDGLYPIPNYSTTMNWIEMDYQVSRFHLNQLKQGYSPSFILNFSTGIPAVEEQEDFYREFKRNYSGTDNSGKIILTYSEGQDGKPELIPIQLNDSDDRFVMLQDMTERNIVMGHAIPPQLVILTPGKLGSTEERKELQNEFQSNYVSPRQTQIEECFNEILNTDELQLKKYEL